MKITYNYVVKFSDGTSHEVPFTFTEHTKIYAIVRSVARSGMSRTMSFYMVEDGELINITHVVAEVCGYKLNEDNWTIRVRGCGMDMIFATLDHFAKGLGFKDTPEWVNHYGSLNY